VHSAGVGEKAQEANETEGVNETEGARVVGAGVMSPGEGVWSDPTN
jgi:hypothetical protein